MQRATLLLLLGCSSSHPEVPPDVPQGATTLVTLDPQGTTFDVVAVKDGDAAWARVPLDGGVYPLHVHDSYVVATICDQTSIGFNVFTGLIGRTVSDGASFVSTCDKTLAATVDASGTMVQAGDINFGDDLMFSETANWAFTVPVTPKTHNAMAFTTASDRVELRRDLDLSTAQTLTPAFDAVARGVALEPVSFSATNAVAGETIRASLIYRLDDGDIFFQNPDDNPAMLLPESQLRAGEVNSVSVQAVTPTTGRFLRRDFHTGDATAYTLPPALAQVTTELDGPRLVATLPPGLPATFDVGDVFLIATNTDFGLDFEFTPSFAAAGKLVFDQDIPGMLPAWKTDLHQALDPSLFVQRTVGGDLITQSSDVVVSARHARRGRHARDVSRR